MAAPQALRSNYSDFVGTAMLPMMEEVFRSEYNQHASKRDMLFKKESTDSQIWQYSEIHDMPLFSSVNEGEDYSAGRTKQGYDVTASVIKYGLLATFAEELVADSKFGHIADTLRKMAKSARESKEVAGMDILNNGFSGTTTGDGLALFHAAHTTPTGTYTVRNKLSADSDLSVSSLKTAVQDFRSNFKGDSGIIYDIKPKFLVVPEALRLDAIQIVQSDLLSGTNNNDINSLKNEGLQVVSSVHLTDTDAWFLIGDPMDTGLRVVERSPIETKASGGDFGFLNDAIGYKARYREKVLAVHPYGVFGTPGA